MESVLLNEFKHAEQERQDKASAPLALMSVAAEAEAAASTFDTGGVAVFPERQDAIYFIIAGMYIQLPLRMCYYVNGAKFLLCSTWRCQIVE